MVPQARAKSAGTPGPLRLPPSKLRRLALASQGLLKKAPFGRGAPATLRVLERIGYVQIDAISVVARAHHHVLHSRIPNYDPAHLDTLTANRSIFEYWFHAAAYLPMRDYRFALPHMEGMRAGTQPWIRSRDGRVMKEVLARVRAEGPLKTRDFETAPRNGGTWWDWKPAKRALEQLFMQGDLMVTGRQGLEKTYDLAERVLPEGTDTRTPGHDEMARHLLRVHLEAHGFIAPRCVTYGRRGKGIRQALNSALQDGVASGGLRPLLQPCGTVAYAEPERLEARAAPATGRATLLSPFDNAVIHRKRARSLFGFEYGIECYLKEEDRRYGYFCLPILYRDRLIGRADCKAHRQTGRFEVKHLHFEPDLVDEDGLVPALADAILRFARFNDCTECTLQRVSGGPNGIQARLARALDA